jgi:uncharacterized protein with von Willebrand factor type A (vWA) domain
MEWWLDKTIGEFVSALRKADLSVSPAETLDAFAALNIIGFEDKVLLKNSLSIILAKTVEEKVLFDTCFDRFFSFTQFGQARQQPIGVDDGVKQPAFRQSGLEGDDPRQKGRRRKKHDGALAHHSSRLGHMLLQGDQAALSLAMQEAASAVHLDQIKSLRERSLYSRRIMLHMGISELNAEIDRPQKEHDDRANNTALYLRDGRAYLTEQVRNFVEEQYLLLVDGTGNRFISEAVTSTKLTNMQRYYFGHIRDAVRKLAHQLAKRHAKRRKITNRGMLDVRRTIRSNLAYDGNLFDVQWKQIKLERPKVFAICDVSGSVKNVSRFLLTFLYSLNEVLPRVRSFAFSNELGEVTELFERYSLDEAIDMSLDDYGKGTTDYGQAFRDFKEIALGDLDSKSTIIILGDGRNNYYEPQVETLKEIAQKCKQVIWLNPESRDRWESGDAEMKKFAACCTYTDVCNSLKDLERIVGRVLKSSA